MAGLKVLPAIPYLAAVTGIYVVAFLKHPFNRNMNGSIGLSLLILLLMGCNARHHNRVINLTDAGWSFELPAGMTFKDSAFNQNGEIKNSSWDSTSPGSGKRVELFWIETDKNNYFNTIVRVDTSDDASWEKKNTADSKFYLEALTQSVNYKLIDSALSVQKISNAVFRKEYFKAYNMAQGDTIHSYKFSRKYRNYDININIRFTDPQTGEKYLVILQNGEFRE